MRTAIIMISGVLWLWFLGCTFTWRFGKVLLVAGMGFKSLEFATLVLFTVGISTYIIAESVGQWMLLAELALWLIVQFFCHWYYTIFGTTTSKLKGYNKCFEGTARLFPVSETRLIPDLYHSVLHLLIAVDLALVVVTVILR